MIIYIDNPKNYHYEIIESLIIKYNEILNINFDFNKTEINIFIRLVKENESFINYIKNKYSFVNFEIPEKYDYYVCITTYDKDYINIKNKNSKNHFYISHDISKRLESLSNVYFLTPLAKKYITTNIFESKNKIKTDIPVYIIQGNLNHGRRNYSLLEKILDNTYNQKFKIKLVGNGDFPKKLEKYSKKILLKNNLNFEDFHKEFLDGYCILPLITKKSHPQYYTKKLTSTMNYASGYDLKCLIDEDLQNIYQLKNVEVFKNENDIVEKFIKTLQEFYDKKKVSTT